MNKQALELLTMLEWCHRYGKHLVYGDLGVLLRLHLSFADRFPCLANLYTNIATTGALVDSLDWHLEFVLEASLVSNKDIANLCKYQ